MGKVFKVGLIVPAGDGVPVGFSQETYHDPNHAPASLPCHQYDGWRRLSSEKATLKHGFLLPVAA